MKLHFMLLANYAEDNSGLLYIIGGGWDTLNVRGPISATPGGPVAMIQGTLVSRLLLHTTETGTPHMFAVQVLDEDGNEVAKLEGEMKSDKNPGLPPGWDQGVNLVIPLTGVPLPRVSRYEVALTVDGIYLGSAPFRVLKLY